MVEPFNFPAYGCNDISYWEWNSPWTNKFFPGCSYAIATQANGGNYYAHNEYGQWIWRAPYGTFIEWAEFQGTDFGHSDGGYTATCATRGIYDPYARVWQGGFGADHTGFVSGPTTNCTPWANSTWSQSVGYQKDLTTDPNDAQGAIGNMAVFQLWMYGNGYRAQNAWALSRGAQFHLYDRDSPYFSSAEPPDSTAFVDDNAARTHRRTVRSYDGGVGVNQLHLYTSRGTPDGAFNLAYVNRGCAGTRPNGGCRGTWTTELAYTLPEGVNTIRVYAKDQLEKFSPMQDWKQSIDRSAPVVGALSSSSSGSLYTSRSDIVSELGYKLNLSATDGSRTSDSAKRSGVAKLEVLVDGVSRHSVTQTCTHPDRSCPLNPSVNPAATWTTPEGFFEPGTHQIEIVATDALGHRSAAGSRVFQINVRSDEQDPEVTVTAGPPAADGSYDLTVTATDGQPIGGAAGAVGSGVEYLEVYLNGQLLDDEPQECPNGGCSITRTYRLSGSQSLAQAEVIAFADDGAENGGVRPAGKKVSGFQFFGYNDSPATFQDHLGIAVSGQAKIVRFPLDWCAVVKRTRTVNGSEIVDYPMNPAEWTWGGYDAVFGAIATYNRTVGESGDISVIPTTSGAPPWAANRPDSAGCNESPPPSPDTEDEAAWATFNGMVVDRYGAADFGLRAIEIWNEPNTAKFWKAPRDPSRFARLVNKANLAIEAYDGPSRLTRPSLGPVLVLPGGLSPEDQDAHRYLDNTLDPARGAGADDHLTFGAIGQPNAVDALSVHLYSSFTDSTKDARSRIRADYLRLSDVMTTRGFANTPRWITEIGFPTVPGPPRGIPPEAASPIRQCRRLRDNFLRFAMRDKVDVFIAHRLIDPPPEDADKNDFGVINRDLSNKPAYGVLRRMATKGGQHEDLSCN